MSASRQVFTDGACAGNPGPGGWAWAVPDGPYASGFEPRTTNQRMELTAALQAVSSNHGPLEVMSDSTYVVNCFRDRWWEGWIGRGWRTSQRKPVANRDLWEPLVQMVRDRGDVTFRWVKGHSGDEMNDRVDRLAVEAIEHRRGREGTGVPADLAAPSGTSARAAAGPVSSEPGRDRRLPEGRLLGVFGLRPPELGGYVENPVQHAVKAKLGEILRAKAELHPDLVVVSGLRLGAEILAAEAAQESGLRLVAVLPHPDPDSVWPEPSRERFARVAGAADAILTLERKVPDSRQKAGASLRRRDAWLARNLDEAVVVWDGEDALVGKLVRTLEDHLGADVWIVDPAEL